MSRFYYVHPESGCAFSSEVPPEVVLASGDGLCMEVDRHEYLKSCIEWGIEPDLEPIADLLGDLL